jgi:hypothetical protein
MIRALMAALMVALLWLELVLVFPFLLARALLDVWRHERQGRDASAPRRNRR